jgi:hypothetical protein
MRFAQGSRREKTRNRKVANLRTGNNMTIITGTAWSKNTPVEVLQELERQERKAMEQGNTSHVAPPAREQEEQNAPGSQTQPRCATPVRD